MSLTRSTPICSECEVVMRCVKNDVIFADPGPSTFWRGDRYKCPTCDCSVVTGWGEPYTDPALNDTTPRRFVWNAGDAWEAKR